MTEVDFYILPEDNQIAPLQYAARLIEKALRLNRRIYVHTLNDLQTQQLSQALWQRPNSFLAHNICSEDQNTNSQILLSHIGNPGKHDDVMVNLAGVIPPFFSRFQRVAEIVPGNPESRTQCRNNYRFYKERGYALRTHTI